MSESKVPVLSASLTELEMESPSTSALSDYFLKVPDSIAICKYCNEIFKDPRLLNCLHSFCKECVGELITVNAVNVIQCPSCNDTMPLPSEGIDFIPSNLYLQHEAKIATYDNQMKMIPPPHCDECSRDPATATISFCCTCVSFLCEECHTQHRLSRKAILHHKTLMLKDTTDVRVKLRKHLTFLPAKCPLHIKEDVKLFCSKCNVLLCIQCALTQHSGHAMDDLSSFVKREKLNMSEEVKEMPNMVARLDDLIVGGKRVTESIFSREKSIGEEVSKVFLELHQNLEQRKLSLLDHCADIVCTKTKGLARQMEELAFLKDCISTCNQFVSSSKEGYDESEYLSVVSTLHTRVSDLSEKINQVSMELSEDDIIHFTADTTTVANALLSLGCINVCKHRDYTTMHEPIITVKTSNAYHASVHRNGDIIVANHIGDAIEIYDSAGNKKRTFGTEGTKPGELRHPLGITTVGDIIYVVEFSGGRCQKMTVGGEFLCEIGSGQMKGAWGCTVSKNGVLYVAEEGNNRVQAFTPNGTILKMLCCAPVVYSPRDVAIDKQGKIHVAACGSKCVKVFDPSGALIRDYGGGVLMEPSGVAVDCIGFCFVGDWGGKSLHVFDPVGRHIHKVAFDGCISGVTIDHSHVYVVNHSAQKIYKY